MSYLYRLANASLTQRVITYLSKMGPCVKCVTLLFLNDCWLVRLQFTSATPAWQQQNCLAFLQENGFPYLAPAPLTLALKALDEGHSVTDVMHEHQVVIISHGMPRPDDLQNFRQLFIAGLGYCPSSLV